MIEKESEWQIISLMFVWNKETLDPATCPHVFLSSEFSYTKEVQPRCLKVATATSATSVLTKLFNKTDELHGLSMEVIPKLKHEQEIRDESILLLLKE